MKTKLFRFLLTLTLIFGSLYAHASDSEIDSLCNSLFESSNRYMESGTEYRVVKRRVMDAHFTNIKGVDKRKTTLIDNSAKEINDLKSQIEQQENDFSELNEKYIHAKKVSDGIEIFSMIIPKNQYNLMVWSLVTVLLACIVVLLMMFKRNNQVTRHAKKELSEKIEEFDAYRKRTLKREQEVASGYVREIKKLKDKIGGL